MASGQAEELLARLGGERLLRGLAEAAVAAEDAPIALEVRLPQPGPPLAAQGQSSPAYMCGGAAALWGSAKGLARARGICARAAPTSDAHLGRVLNAPRPHPPG